MLEYCWYVTYVLIEREQSRFLLEYKKLTLSNVFSLGERMVVFE